MNQTFILPRDTEAFRQALRGMSNDKRYRAALEEYQPRRSLPANAFYWSCVVTPLAEACGYTPDELHDEILGAHFGWEKKQFMGHEREIPRRRSSKLTTPEFQDLIHHGQRIAAELGIVLPDENQAA